MCSSDKVDIKTKGLNSIENDVVQQNLMGRSRYMKNKEWRDAQGRKGKVRCSHSSLWAACLCVRVGGGGGRNERVVPLRTAVNESPVCEDVSLAEPQEAFPCRD